MTFKIKGKEM